MSIREMLSKILPEGVLTPVEKEYEFMKPQRLEIPIPVKAEWREPVQSLLDSIKRGAWEVSFKTDFSSMECTVTYSLAHRELSLSFSISKKVTSYYGVTEKTESIFGEAWMTRKEAEAVFEAADIFDTRLNIAFRESANKQREQEFMQLTKEK